MSLDPAIVMTRLDELDRELATKAPAIEAAAQEWYLAKRDREHKRAVAFISAEGTVAERNAIADRDTAMYGREAEALWEALRAVVRVLETRASIGQSLLKSYGRGA